MEGDMTITSTCTVQVSTYISYKGEEEGMSTCTCTVQVSVHKYHI